jgi:hypothetical protein
MWHAALACNGVADGVSGGLQYHHSTQTGSWMCRTPCYVHCGCAPGCVCINLYTVQTSCLSVACGTFGFHIAVYYGELL